MIVKLNVKDKKSLSKTLCIFTFGLVVAFVIFMILSILSLAAVHFGVNGFNENSVQLLEHKYILILDNPSYLLEIFANWQRALSESLASKKIIFPLFIPLSVPIFSVILIWEVFTHSSYAFSLWYMFNNHYARYDDVKKMGLLDGRNMVLGRFKNWPLGLSGAGSVLCLGENGCGKTSTVAIPSILQADNSSVVVMDNTGSLVRYTSGYRATLGPVYYFNWDMDDDKDKKIIYPRWNPLAKINLPTAPAQREEYIRFLASHFISMDEVVEKDNYWDWLASGILATFMEFLIAKCEQAISNDYFLSKILEGGHVAKDDADILLSFYASMPKQYTKTVINKLQQQKLGIDDYLPIGSWEGIPNLWQGKEVCPAMLTDWIFQNYLDSRDDNNSDWHQWLEQLIIEARLFNYGENIIEGLQQFLYLSKQQRQIVFAYVLKPLRIFLNQTLRVKTSSNDLETNALRGYWDEEKQKYCPITIYSAANSKTSKLLNRLFLEVLLYKNMAVAKTNKLMPILMVLDDAGHMLKIRELAESVARGALTKTSFLLLCNSLNSIENVYGTDTVENLVANINYKIVMADNSIQMGRQLKKLAIFATKSVQIPRVTKSWCKNKKYFADAVYFHHLAQKLQINKNLKIDTKGYQLLLVAGYYHRPILTSHIHFLRDDAFRKKAIYSASYILDEKLVGRRNLQDEKVPEVDEVLGDINFDIDDEIELNKYIKNVYDEVKSKVEEDAKIETIMINDISEKWRKISGKSNLTYNNVSNDWWLNEKSFDVAQKENMQNPFAIKK